MQILKIFSEKYSCMTITSASRSKICIIYLWYRRKLAQVTIRSHIYSIVIWTITSWSVNIYNREKKNNKHLKSSNSRHKLRLLCSTLTLNMSRISFFLASLLVYSTINTKHNLLHRKACLQAFTNGSIRIDSLFHIKQSKYLHL